MKRKGRGSVSDPIGDGEGKKSIQSFFPWLKAFDEEAKVRLDIDFPQAHVLKLLTLLENHISPEVSKLKKKPNRATKLLTQVRKRLGIAKIAGTLLSTSGGDSDVELFPTYGLLMMHYVNLVLVSSNVEKKGAPQVAADLYFLLKIIFQGGNEYILDVAICSTLDEHADSRDTVGFQLFSFIVEDWRCYSETHSSLMKYCAVSSLLMAASTEGRLFVDRHLPSNVNPQFISYLSRRRMDMHFSKKPTLIAVVQKIRTIFVKSISRERLVLISKRRCKMTKRNSTGGNESDDGDSSASTAVNVPSSTNAFRQRALLLPSTSGCGDYDKQRGGVDSSLNELLGQIGLHLNIPDAPGFTLDTDGDQTLTAEYGSNNNPSDDEDETEYFIDDADGTVSSSSAMAKEENTDERDSQEDPFVYDPCHSDAEQMDTEDDDENQIKPKKIKVTSEVIDSDLEVLSVKGDESESCSEDEGTAPGKSTVGCENERERDEEEAESGEDVVPNYDEDSDAEDEVTVNTPITTIKAFPPNCIPSANQSNLAAANRSSDEADESEIHQESSGSNQSPPTNQKRVSASPPPQSSAPVISAVLMRTRRKTRATAAAASDSNVGSESKTSGTRGRGRVIPTRITRSSQCNKK